MKMKALYVNHNDETFAELTHGQALDVIFNADNAEMYGDHVNQIVDLGNEIKLELYRNNEFVPFAGYYERVKTLSELYTNISDWFASRLLDCISKRYKGGKEVVKNTPTIKHETFRVYYKGDDDLFVVILPICALGNDGVVFRK